MIDYHRVIRQVVKDIGYDDHAKGFDYSTCNILSALEGQASEIAEGVYRHRSLEDIGAGDQGIMFGYATDETPTFMPMTLSLSHALVERYGACMKSGELPWARPDCKSQVTIEHKMENGAVVPLKVHTIVFSCQHSPSIDLRRLREEVFEKVIKKVIPANMLTKDTIFLINPCGTFILGGPVRVVCVERR